MPALLLALLPLVALAAPAPVDLAGDDLALSRLLVRQEREMQAAGKVLEDWASGRLDPAEARAAVRAALERCRSLEGEIGRRAGRAEASLGGAARRAARQRTVLVESLAALVGRGAAGPKELLALGEQQGRAASTSLGEWLGSRLDAARRLGTLPAPAGLASYYRWQRGLIPLQLEAVALGERLRRVVDQLAGGRPPEPPGLYRQGRALLERVGRLEVDPALREAREASRREFESLARLAEAVDLMVDDPSPESHARLARWSARVQKDSAEAQVRSLEALARALRP